MTVDDEFVCEFFVDCDMLDCPPFKLHLYFRDERCLTKPDKSDCKRYVWFRINEGRAGVSWDFRFRL